MAASVAAADLCAVARAMPPPAAADADADGGLKVDDVAVVDGDDEGIEEELRLPGTAATCASSLTRSNGATSVLEAAPESAPARAIFHPVFLLFSLSFVDDSGDDDEDEDNKGEEGAASATAASAAAAIGEQFLSFLPLFFLFLSCPAPRDVSRSLLGTRLQFTTCLATRNESERETSNAEREKKSVFSTIFD